MPESALVVVVPEAEALVSDIRLRFDPVARLGVPAHITLPFPFMALDAIIADVIGRIGAAISVAERSPSRLPWSDDFRQPPIWRPSPPSHLSS